MLGEGEVVAMGLRDEQLRLREALLAAWAPAFGRYRDLLVVFEDARLALSIAPDSPVLSEARRLADESLSAVLAERTVTAVERFLREG